MGSQAAATAVLPTANTMLYLAGKSERQAFLDKFDTFLVDMDGVLWQGSTLIPGVKEALARLRALGKRLIFVTNSSIKSRQSYVDKFQSLGLVGVTRDDIFGSSYAAACYMTMTNFPKDKHIYVLGHKGMFDELEEQGFTGVGGDDDKDLEFTGIDDLCQIQPDSKIGAVLCGFDGYINYAKLAKAHTYLSDPNVIFVSTNGDSTYPVGERVFPGSGSLFQPLVASTGRTPVITGKPSATMLELILKTHRLDLHRTCMIGDRLDTDIEFGLSGGCHTLLVLTGVTKEEKLRGPSNRTFPHFYANSLGDFQDA